MEMQLKGFLRILLALIIALSLIACSANEKNANSSTQQGTVEWVDPSIIQRGPIRHESLTEEQLSQIRRIHNIFYEVDGQSIEAWIDDFKRDIDPDSELEIWERMASAYSKYCKNRNLSIEAKREVYSIVLLRSMVPENEVLTHAELEILSVDDAKEVMEGF